MVLLDRERLNLTDPVARYWPEFAANGKASITIADALSHRAGLFAVPAPATKFDLLDDVGMAERLAAAKPAWPVGQLAYHALTYGWIAGELVRRICGVSIGTFFANEIAAPLGLDAWIGLPPSLEARVATLALHDSFATDLEARRENARAQSAYGDPALFSEPLPWNDPSWHRQEVPGGNGITTARAMAALYGCLACAGRLGDTTLVREPSIAACVAERARGIDALTGDPLAFATGFELQGPEARFGPSAGAFGHGGAGGSIHGAWPAHRTGFSYVMNQLREEASDDRSRTLLASLYVAVANRPSQRCSRPKDQE
jgi:CubicO group peptidase (beta-lactamase class C family)